MPARGPERSRRGWTRKNLQIDQRKLDAARAILGTTTEAETVDAALDAIVFGRQPVNGIRRVRAAGSLRVVQPWPT
jgi:hypothetical protein